MTFGVCNWFLEHGRHLVAPHDLEGFAALRPNGKIFQCVGTEAGFLLLSYGDKLFHVNQDVVKAVPSPEYRIGQTVMAKDKLGVVVDIEWHFKDLMPIYYLAFEGKRSSRRHFGTELAEG